MMIHCGSPISYASLRNKLLQRLLSWEEFDKNQAYSPERIRYVPVFTVLLTTVRSDAAVIFLYVQESSVVQEKSEAPLARHGAPKRLSTSLRSFIACMLMWTQEVIVSDPECQIIVGTDQCEPNYYGGKRYKYGSVVQPSD